MRNQKRKQKRTNDIDRVDDHEGNNINKTKNGRLETEIEQRRRKINNKKKTNQQIWLFFSTHRCNNKSTLF